MFMQSIFVGKKIFLRGSVKVFYGAYFQTCTHGLFTDGVRMSFAAFVAATSTLYQYWEIWEAAVREVLWCEQVRCNARDIHVRIQQLWKRRNCYLPLHKEGSTVLFFSLFAKKTHSLHSNWLKILHRSTQGRSWDSYLLVFFWYRWWRIG